MPEAHGRTWLLHVETRQSCRTFTTHAPSPKSRSSEQYLRNIQGKQIAASSALVSIPQETRVSIQIVRRSRLVYLLLQVDAYALYYAVCTRRAQPCAVFLRTCFAISPRKVMSPASTPLCCDKSTEPAGYSTKQLSALRNSGHYHRLGFLCPRGCSTLTHCERVERPEQPESHLPGPRQPIVGAFKGNKSYTP